MLDQYTKAKDISTDRVEFWRRQIGNVHLERTVYSGEPLKAVLVRWTLIGGDGIASSLSCYAMSEEEAEQKAALISERAEVMTRLMVNG